MNFLLSSLDKLVRGSDEFSIMIEQVDAGGKKAAAAAEKGHLPVLAHRLV